jgi:hypothetical protein
MGRNCEAIFSELKNISQFHNLKFSKIRDLFPHYSLQQLANHRAIVIFPYAVMSYSLVDFYISNIPMFVPSVKLMSVLKNVNDRTHKGNCGSEFIDIERHPSSIHKLSPNDDSDEPYKYWLQYADYFQWPHVTIFESLKDLIQKLKTMNLKDISDKMKRYNKVREANLLDNWCRVLKHDTRDSAIPRSFKEALDYFGMNPKLHA